MLRLLLLRPVLALALVATTTGCATHSTATRWNGHVGPHGEPVFVLTSTYLGLHFAGMVPFAGETTIDRMVDESTRWIQASEGSHLRLIETETNNYWYGLPPLSWFVSPVMTSVTFEYRPTAAALARAGVATPSGDAAQAAKPQR